jgi:ATP:ADP antiporter, AAA family
VVHSCSVAVLLLYLCAVMKKQSLFLTLAMLCGFLISAEYAVIRPVSQTLFIHAYSTLSLPYAWLAAVPLSLLIVALYNRYLPRLGCLKMFVCVISAIICVNSFCALFLHQIRCLPFFFYMWKEAYIMLMFQQLWSVIHSTVEIQRARYLYGILFGVGGLGAALGSLIPGFFAVKAGSESLVLVTLPLYALLFVVFFFMLKHGGSEIQTLKKEIKPSFTESVRALAQSPALLLILSLVICMQVSSGLIEYQFNTVLEKTVLDKDLRTEYQGKIMSIVNFSIAILQFFGTYLIVRFLGLKGSHLLVPLILCSSAVAFLFFPFFGVISFGFITVKILDFSLFGVIKEMLYIPLPVEGKFRAKAIIDVFAYRGSKALASGFILLLQFFLGTQISAPIGWGLVGLFIAWGLIVSFFLKHQESAASARS